MDWPAVRGHWLVVKEVQQQKTANATAKWMGGWMGCWVGNREGEEDFPLRGPAQPTNQPAAIYQVNTALCVTTLLAPQFMSYVVASSDLKGNHGRMSQ